MKRVTSSIKSSISIFLVLFGLLNISTFVIIQYYELKQSNDSVLVNVSGRNRMLSQKISFYSEVIAKGKVEARKDLLEAVNLHAQSLQVLRSGAVPGLINNTVIPPADKKILPALDEIDKIWSDFKRSASVIVNASIKKDSENTLDSQVEEALTFIEANASEVLKRNNDLVQAYVKIIEARQALLNTVLLICMIANLMVIGLAFFFTKNYILRPIKSIAIAADKIATGASEQKVQGTKDPWIQKIVKSIKQLSSNIRKAEEFVKSVGDGHYDVELAVDHDNNVLFTELSHMRDKLKTVSEADKRRHWANHGLTQFGEILRNNQHDIDELSAQIISHLVKHLNANQGGIFVIDNKNNLMELTGCYAWERKRFAEKKIERGQGLLGQCWLEQETIYMTDIPDEYVNITSGLGKATPNCLLLVPLKLNGEVFGVIEIASFDILKQHQVEFAETLAENIAATLNTMQTNAKTKNLLEETQEQAEQMRAQEEEIRQNMEEIQATQEEMARKQLEMDAQMSALNATNGVIEFNSEGHILNANDLFLACTQYNLSEVEGRHHRMFVDNEYAQSNEYEKFWSDLRSGKSISGEFRRKTKDGTEIWLKANYNAIFDTSGKVTKIIKIAMDVTDQKVKQLENSDQKGTKTQTTL